MGYYSLESRRQRRSQYNLQNSYRAGQAGCRVATPLGGGLESKVTTSVDQLELIYEKVVIFPG